MARHTVRNLTLAHLDRLIAIGLVTTACNTTDVGFGVVDPMPLPASGPPSDPAEEARRGAIPEAGDTGKSSSRQKVPTADPPPSGPDRGYAVVDPAPHPAICRTLAESLRGTLSEREDGILLVISRGSYSDASLAIPSTATATGAAIRSFEASDARTVRLVLDVQTWPASVTLRGTCNGVEERARVVLKRDEAHASLIRATVEPVLESP